MYFTPLENPSLSALSAKGPYAGQWQLLAWAQQRTTFPNSRPFLPVPSIHAKIPSTKKQKQTHDPIL